VLFLLKKISIWHDYEKYDIKKIALKKIFVNFAARFKITINHLIHY